MPKLWKILDLFNYAQQADDADSDSLIGLGWLGKGMGGLLVGQTGIGKSSLTMQAMILWALGLDLFGMNPVKPLRVLLIQAENGKQDMAEMVEGVVLGLRLESRMAELNERLIVVSEDSSTGSGFAKLLERLINEHRPDLVFADPLLSFIGGNLSDQETVSTFLRNFINPVLHETGAAMIFVHHTNKPVRDPQRNGYIGAELAYLGAGSAELANWSRAVLTLREMREGQYELRGAKRGNRSGLIGGDTAFLKHSNRTLCWELASDSDANIQDVVHDDAAAVLEELKKPSLNGKGWPHSSVIKSIVAIRGGKPTGAKAFFTRHLRPHLNYSDGFYQPKGCKVADGCN